MTVSLQHLFDLLIPPYNVTYFEFQVRAFVTQGGDIDAALDEHDDRTLLHAAVQIGWTEGIAILLAHKPDLAKTNRHGAPVYAALVDNTVLDSKKRIAVFEQLTAHDPASLQSPDWRGYTPLHLATRQNDLPMIRLLLAHHPNLHAATTYDETALDIAIENHFFDAATLLKTAIATHDTQYKNPALNQARKDPLSSTCETRLRR